jgi:hypothetical protein
LWGFAARIRHAFSKIAIGARPANPHYGAPTGSFDPIGHYLSWISKTVALPAGHVALGVDVDDGIGGIFLRQCTAFAMESTLLVCAAVAGPDAKTAASSQLGFEHLQISPEYVAQ